MRALTTNEVNNVNGGGFFIPLLVIAAAALLPGCGDSTPEQSPTMGQAAWDRCMAADGDEDTCGPNPKG